MAHKFFKNYIDLYTRVRIPIPAAALSYYITLTFFPMVICIFTLLGNNYDSAMKAIDFISAVMPESTVDYLIRFVDYVSHNINLVMFLLAFSVIIISASAAFRSIVHSIGIMQGGVRFQGNAFFLTSLILPIVFLLVVYLCIIGLFLSDDLLGFVDKLIPMIDFSGIIRNLRFIVMFVLAFAAIIIVFKFCQQKENRYGVIWGALISTAGLLLVTLIFSFIISVSIKYPVLYSSLSAIILLMFWLYCGCFCIYIGAAFNITLRDIRHDQNEK